MIRRHSSKVNLSTGRLFYGSCNQLSAEVDGPLYMAGMSFLFFFVFFFFFRFFFFFFFCMKSLCYAVTVRQH